MIPKRHHFQLLLWSAVVSSFLFAPHAFPATRYRMESANAPVAAADVVVVATRVDVPAETLRQTAKVPSDGVLPATEGTWKVSIESSSFWAPDTSVDASESIVIIVHPAATATAAVSSDQRVMPQYVRLRLSGGDKKTPALSTVCPVAEQAIKCQVPAGTFDIRVSAAGYAPHYQWNVAFAAGETVKLSRVRLIRGAAVIGRVLYMPSGTDLAVPPDARVALRPASSPSDAKSRVALHATVNAKGHFTVAAVPPGEYLITAYAKGLTSDPQHIRVLADATSELKDPLVVTPPKVIRALLSPPLDPEGVPWAIVLWRHRGNQREVVSSSSVEADGAWKHGVRSGKYSVVVARRDGAQWASADVRVDTQDVDVTLFVPAVVAFGNISYGDQPIAARLHFGGESGRPRQTVTSDEHGRFRGVLPVIDGNVWEVFVESDVPSIRRTIRSVRGRVSDEGLEFDILLPRTLLSGSVINTDGTPEPYAIVTAAGDSARPTFDQIVAAEDGTFDFHGLEPGFYRITAESHLKGSDDVRTEIVLDDEHAPLLIPLKPVAELRGRVVAHGGIPVIGASLELVRRNGSPVSADATTNDSGAFVLAVPAETTLFDLLVAPPGFAFTMARLPLRTDKELLVDADPHGGTVMTNVPRGTNPMLHHGGALVPVELLVAWLDGTTEERRESLLSTLPMMERGEYTVCIGIGRCKSGYLAPGGTLELAFDQR
jgi:hypothetical protein